MLRACPVAGARAVVELGPGTGAFTKHIVAALPRSTSFAAIEKSPALARVAASNFPRATVVEGCATRLREHLGALGMPAPEAVLSGLPWAAFPGELQDTILREIAGALAPGGVFVTFAYYGPHRLAAGRRFRAALDAKFPRVERTRVVLRNFPPAFVYRCSA